MLLVLTGHIQQGKSRWLEAQLNVLEAAGMRVCGVLAPGVWEPCTPDAEHPQHFRKLGIDMVLYPAHERFACGVDCSLAAQAAGAVEDELCSVTVNGAKLGWEFYPESFARANAVFASWHRQAREGASQGNLSGSCLLVVDEIGPMELHGRGLHEAMALLSEGPTPLFAHALVVVRDFLVGDFLQTDAAGAWGSDVQVIAPDAAGEGVLQGLLADCPGAKD